MKQLREIIGVYLKFVFNILYIDLIMKAQEYIVLTVVNVRILEKKKKLKKLKKSVDRQCI